MSKKDLIDAIAERTGLSKTDSTNALNATLEEITKALESGSDVALTGFGTFTVGNRPERSGRNPRTGEPMTIAAARVPKFKPGKGLKEAVNAA